MLINNIKLLNIIYLKKKINYLFSNSKFIIFIEIKNIFNLKKIFLKYNLFSIVMKEREIKALFNMPNFLFIRGGQYICCFINDIEMLINVIILLENKQIFYSYKNNLSNFISCLDIVDLFKKYNVNYFFIQFLLKKIKIKVIILLLFFLILFTKYIK